MSEKFAHEQDRPTKPFGQWLRLVGPSQPLGALNSSEVISALHSTDKELALEISASQTAMDIGIGCDPEFSDEVARAIFGASPNWEISAAKRMMPSTASLCLEYRLDRPKTHRWSPLKNVKDFGDVDPLAAILEAVQPLEAQEQLLIRYLVRPVNQKTRKKALRALTVPASPKHLVDLLFEIVGMGGRVPRFEPQLQKTLERRLHEPAFELVGLIALAGSNHARLHSRARSLAGVFASRFGGDLGGLVLRDWSMPSRPSNLHEIWHRKEFTLYATIGELAALWHLPSNRVLAPGVSHLRRPVSLLPWQIEGASGLLLGVHRQRGREVQVRLPRRDLQAGSMAVIGRTGVGKSTMVHQICRQLIAAPDGCGLGLIDPHGDLVFDIASGSIPTERETDVVLLDLGDADFPIGLPLFWAPPNVPYETLVENTFSLLRLLFREHWSPTRMADAVFAIAATLCQLPQATLLDVPRLLNDPVFRRKALAKVEDPVAQEFWQDFEQMPEGAQRETARPILYRIRALYRSKPVRNILCQTSGLDFLEMVNNGRIILVSLAGSGIQAEADLLGELVIARLHLAALARLALPKEQRRPFFLAVDESQRFRGVSLPVLLSEGRKLGLSLILSTQFLDSWGEELCNSILGNAGTQVSFRCGPNDSRRLSASLKPFTPDQLEDLDRFEAIVKLQIQGTTMPSVDIKTTPIEAACDNNALDRIREFTRQRYARPRLEVEREMDAAYSTSSGLWERHDVDED